MATNPLQVEHHVRCVRPAAKFRDLTQFRSNEQAAEQWRAKHNALPLEHQLRFDPSQAVSYERPDLGVYWP